MRKIIVKLNDEILDQITGEPIEAEHQLNQRIAQGKYPDGYTTEEGDTTAEIEAEKQKKAKKEAALAALQNLEAAKGTTIAALRAEHNALVELLKEVLK